MHTFIEMHEYICTSIYRHIASYVHAYIIPIASYLMYVYMYPVYILYVAIYVCWCLIN